MTAPRVMLVAISALIGFAPYCRGGIAPENIARLFARGFTTRKKGHGFGLHSCLLAAKEMGSTLMAHSEGPGKGAISTLELPIETAGDTP